MHCTMRAASLSSSSSSPMSFRACSTSATCCRASPRATWSRPQVDRDNDFIKPSFVPKPFTTPLYQPDREEGKPLYSPPPEMPRRQSEVPDKSKELPEGPKMPERRPDPIPAGERRRQGSACSTCHASPMRALLRSVVACTAQASPRRSPASQGRRSGRPLPRPPQSRRLPSRQPGPCMPSTLPQVGSFVLRAPVEARTPALNSAPCLPTSS